MPEDRLKCGNCNSEYFPRFVDALGMSKDYSCPVCGHGKRNIQELQKQQLKQNILKG